MILNQMDVSDVYGHNRNKAGSVHVKGEYLNRHGMEHTAQIGNGISPLLDRKDIH